MGKSRELEDLMFFDILYDIALDLLLLVKSLNDSTKRTRIKRENATQRSFRALKRPVKFGLNRHGTFVEALMKC